jgi:hypothetical protein
MFADQYIMEGKGAIGEDIPLKSTEHFSSTTQVLKLCWC